MSYLGVKQIQIAAAVSVAVRHLLHQQDVYEKQNYSPIIHLLLDFSLSIKAAPHECVIRTGQL